MLNSTKSYQMPSDADALRLLSAQGPELEALYARADAVRREHMSDTVFLRGIVEFSNVCANDCCYCGIRASNRKIRRYTMNEDEILEVARCLPESQQTTIVLQSGESEAFGDKELGALIQRIKRETPLAVTLSVGNRPPEVYRYWRECGLDRYLLRFETSDARLFARLHPDCTLEERLACLTTMRDLGVQVGSGFMIGVPGETPAVLSANILLCRKLQLDMIGIGPFIVHPDTPMAGERNAYHDDPDMFFRALAVLRLFNPKAHIPATTAYDAVFPGEGRNWCLQRGANVFMPNSTPAQYRADYQLYPGKPCLNETGEQCAQCVIMRVQALGRTIGSGPGHSRRTQEAPSETGALTD